MSSSSRALLFGQRVYGLDTIRPLLLLTPQSLVVCETRGGWWSSSSARHGLPVLDRGLEAFGVATAAGHGLVALCTVLFDRDGDVAAKALRAPAAVSTVSAISSSGYRGGVDVATSDTEASGAELVVLAIASLGPEVDLVPTATCRRDRPQLALEAVNRPVVVGEHPARGALEDGLPYVFSGDGVPVIG
jgi:hypothetical protein